MAAPAVLLPAEQADQAARSRVATIRTEPAEAAKAGRARAPPALQHKAAMVPAHFSVGRAVARPGPRRQPLPAAAGAAVARAVPARMLLAAAVGLAATAKRSSTPREQPLPIRSAPAATAALRAVRPAATVRPATSRLRNITEASSVNTKELEGSQ